MRQQGRQWSIFVRRVALSGAVLCSACLVTENSDLPRPSDTPVVKAISPISPSHIPSITDPDCANPDPGMKFEASIFYGDTETDNLYLNLFVNNKLYDAQQLGHNGTTFRTPKSPLCVRKGDLILDCNLVELVVTNDFYKQTNVISPFDPSVDHVQWYVWPSASSGRADVDSISACPQPPESDGGV